MNGSLSMYFMIFDALKIVLKRLPAHASVEFAAHFQGAIIWLAARPPIDLLLLDLNLPGSNGTVVLDSIRRRFPSPAVAALSANENREVIADGVDLGAWGYLSRSRGSGAMLSAIQVIARCGIFWPGDHLHRGEAICNAMSANNRTEAVMVAVRFGLRGEPDGLDS